MICPNILDLENNAIISSCTSYLSDTYSPENILSSGTKVINI